MRRILLPALSTALTGSLLTAVVCTRTMMRERSATGRLHCPTER